MGSSNFLIELKIGEFCSVTSYNLHIASNLGHQINILS